MDKFPKKKIVSVDFHYAVLFFLFLDPWSWDQ